jgi:serine/threonine protein kinase
MEFLPGGTLKDFLDASFPLPGDVLKKILLQMCSGLSEIHRHGIIHRDLKTGNIMLDARCSILDARYSILSAPRSLHLNP